MALLSDSELMRQTVEECDRRLQDRGHTFGELLKHRDLHSELEMLMQSIQADVQYNRLTYFEPYEYQRPLYHLGTMAQAVIASNRSGKSYSVGYAIACHLTGIYPEWWTDIKYKRGIRLIAAGSSSAQIREAIQDTLFGTPDKTDELALGTGLIPRDRIIMSSIVTGADRRSIGGCQISHSSGIASQIIIASYEQDRAVLQGGKADVIWLDEQPRNDEIVSELVRSLAQTPSGQEGRLYLSATPLVGWTPMIKRFWNRAEHHGMVRYTWDDVPMELLDKKTRELLIASWLPWEVESRTQGIPMAGEGVVFGLDWRTVITDTVPESQAHFKYISGIDFGRNPDPTALVWMFHDTATDTIWVYDCHTSRNQTPLEYAPHILQRGRDIPLAWPADGRRKGYTETTSAISELTSLGINTLPEPFTNPDGSRGIDYGLGFLLQRMRTGKLKIHANCKPLIEELQQYHTDVSANGKVNFRGQDHHIDALRYAALSLLRFGQNRRTIDPLIDDIDPMTERTIRNWQVNYY